MRYIDADKFAKQAYEVAYPIVHDTNSHERGLTLMGIAQLLDDQPTADVRDYATAHKLVGGGERDGTTCWFECDNCGLTVDIGDVFCKHCGARFVP